MPTSHRYGSAGPPSSQAQTTGDPRVQVTDPAVENGPTSLPSSEVEAPDASPNSQIDEARRIWELVATCFGKAFTATHNKNDAQWRETRAPLVIGKLEEQLATVPSPTFPMGRSSASSGRVRRGQSRRLPPLRH